MAAASSTTGASTAYYIATQNRVSSRNYRFPTYYGAIKQRRRLLVIKNSSDESATATNAESAEIPAELPRGPPSLISALNVEKALRGIVLGGLLTMFCFRGAAISDTDHYGMLGLGTGCSYDQVNVAYKNKVAEVMDKGLAEEELSKELDLLKQSHSILSSVEERRLYDWSLARSGKPDRYMWPFEVDITQTPTEEPPPRVKSPFRSPTYPYRISQAFVHLRVQFSMRKRSYPYCTLEAAISGPIL
ncbi:UNVERIFIED_CONTAM: NAD(P)H-quinone oxidoreductase subunit U, chloroplastic [Sesamum indicum]